MATNEELNNQKKLNQEIEKGNRLLSQRRGIDQDIANDVNDFANTLQDQLKSLKGQVTERQQIRSISREFTKTAQQNYAVLEQELGTNKLSKKVTQDKEKLNKGIISLQRFQNVQLGENRKINADIQGSIEDSIYSTRQLLEQLDYIELTTDKISKNFGVKTLGALSDITKSIPGLRKFSTPFQEASAAAKEQAILNEKINALQGINLKTGKGLTKEKIKELGLADKLLDKNGDILQGSGALKRLNKTGDINILEDLKDKKTLNPLTSGFGNLGKSLTKALGPAAILLELVDAIMAVDTATADMAKQFGMSYDESLKMQASFTNMAASSGDIFVNTKGINETFGAINSALGTSAALSEDMAVSFTQLRERSGFTNEELQGIARIQLGTSKTTDEITGQFIAQAKISAMQNGVLLNEQQLLKDIGKVSAATTLSFGKNPGLIAKAVSTAKSLGLELSKVDDIANSLLNFESSINDELSAELLLGKNINLEKARSASLNNDLATVAQEIADIAGSSAEFAEMNRIQQEALAKAVGMSREELAGTLLLQDQLVGLTGEEAEAATRSFEILKAQVGEKEAMRQLEEQGVERLNNQVGVQEKFNKTVEKLKEVFVNVATAIMPIVSAIGEILGMVGKVMQFLKPITGLLGGAATGAALGSVIPGVGTLIGGVLGGLGGLFSDASKITPANDAYIPSGYGKKMLLEEGQITTAFNNNDNIIATTNPSTPTTTQPTNNNTTVNNNSALLAALEKSNRMLEKIATSEGSININGTKFGTVTAMNTYQIQ